MQTVEQIAAVSMRDDTNNASTQDAIENDAVQMEKTGDDIAYPDKRHCSINREVGSGEFKTEAVDDSKSEADVTLRTR